MSHDVTDCSQPEAELLGCRQSNKAHSDAEALKGRTAEDNQQYDSLAATLKDLEANYRQAGEHLVLYVCWLRFYVRCRRSGVYCCCGGLCGSVVGRASLSSLQPAWDGVADWLHLLEACILVPGALCSC